jgi:hypothetical protein
MAGTLVDEMMVSKNGETFFLRKLGGPVRIMAKKKQQGEQAYRWLFPESNGHTKCSIPTQPKAARISSSMFLENKVLAASPPRSGRSDLRQEKDSFACRIIKAVQFVLRFANGHNRIDELVRANVLRTAHHGPHDRFQSVWRKMAFLRESGKENVTTELLWEVSKDSGEQARGKVD